MWDIRVKEEGEWIELRKEFSNGPNFGNLMIFVCRDGYDYGTYDKRDQKDSYRKSTRGINIRLSSNGPIALTFDQWEDIQNQVEKAKLLLKK